MKLLDGNMGKSSVNHVVSYRTLCGIPTVPWENNYIMNPYYIDLRNLELPPGWSRESLCLDDGTRITALTADKKAETLRIERSCQGRCQLIFGLYRAPGMFCHLEVKIGNGYWRHIRPVHLINDREGGVQEAVLPTPVFNKVDIQIRPVNRSASMGGLAWIRIEEAGSEEEYCPQKHNVGAVFDTHGMFARGGIDDVNDIEAMLAPFVVSDFDRICWGVGAGSFRMLYFSQVLPFFGKGQTSFYNETNSCVAATMKAFHDREIDPFDTALQFCHRNGMKFWANDRICHCWPPGGFNDDFAAPFYLENQHLRTVNAAGGRKATLSLAHKKFQDLKIALYCEWAEKNVDGIYIDLMRKPGVMGIDGPVVREFEHQIGRAPENSDYQTETWFKIRAGFVTDFMRRVRSALDSIGRRKNKKIAIAVQGFAEPKYLPNIGMVDVNLIEGYDIRTWAEEGLIDIFAPSTSRHYQPISLSFHHNLLQSTACELWGCLGQHHSALLPDDYRHDVYFGNGENKNITPIADIDPLRIMRNAADCYNQNAQGIFLWEAGHIAGCPTRWNDLRTLGHRKKWQEKFKPAIGPFDGRHHIRQLSVKHHSVRPSSD